jgi:hypothetical protein
MIGMEHVLQAALTVAFVLEAARVIGGDGENSDAKKTWPILALATALLATRYEGVFPVGIAVVLLAVRRRFGLAAALALAGATPVLLFGAYSMAHGSLFLPNSIALKRQHLKLEELSDLVDILGGNVLTTMALQSYLLPLGFGTLALFAREVGRAGVWSKGAVRLLLAFGTTAAHVELASLGWFFRYEAYLVALDVTVIAIALAPPIGAFSLRGAWRRSRLAFLAGVAAAAVATTPLWVRALAAQGATPMACANIFEQQVQSARLLSRYFPHDTVAINDIGAVAYYGDEPIVDLEGLGTLAVARAKSLQLDKPLSAEQLASFTANAPIAIIYDAWFPRVPTAWVRLGRLRIRANKVCAFDAVSVYATSGESVPRVLAALHGWSASAPADIRREGVWVEAPPEDGAAAWRAEAGDVLSIEVTGAPELSGVFWVDGAGAVWLPKLGEVAVRGLTLAGVADAVRAAGSALPASWPAQADVRAQLVEERRCHVLVAGNVPRSFDEPVDCGTPAARVLERVGFRASAGVEPYVWRSEGDTVRRIEVGGRDAPTVALRGGDIVVAR